MINISQWLQEQLQMSATIQLILVAIVAAVVVHMLTRKRYKLPPGPTPLPIVGNALALLKDDLSTCIRKWHQKYGPVITFSMGPKPIVVINESDAVIEAFVKKGSDFSGRPFLYSLDIMTEGSKDILMTNYGDFWKFQRKVSSQALRQYLTGTQLEERVHEVLQPVIKSMLEQTEPFVPHKHLSLSIFNILTGICFGKVMHLEDPEFIKLLETFDEFNDVIGNGFLEDFFPPLRYWPTKRFTTCCELINEYYSWIYKCLDEQKKVFNPDHVTKLAGNIILAKQTVGAETGSVLSNMFTDTHVGQIISDVIGAGVDTSRTQLGWIVLVVAARPDIQIKIHEEIDRVIGDAVPGREHRSKLVYVEAVMFEAMRLYPVVPLGLPHETMKDTVVGGYEIPAKMTVLANQIAILHDPKHWDDPLTFKPERFLDESGTRLAQKSSSWIPFSLGHRVCLGESLAKLQMVYTIAGLMQRLKFSLSEEDGEPDLSCNQISFLNRPRDYRVIVTSR